MRRTILAIAGDTHGGHRLGLLNPDVTLFDVNEKGERVAWCPQPTATQEYSWDLYMRNYDQVKALAGADEVLFLHGGDECHGKKYPTQLVTDSMANQILIACANLKPWCEMSNVKNVRLSSGTGAHNFLDSSSTVLVREWLAAAYPNVDTQLVYHGLVNFNGLEIDYAHHGPHPGSREWLAGNTARFYLRDLMIQAVRECRKPPDVVLRFHYHTPVFEYLEYAGFTSRLYVVPSYMALDEHAMQATKSTNCLWMGTLAIEIEDGCFIKDHRMYEKLDLRTREVL